MPVAIYVPSNEPIKVFETLTQQIGECSNSDYVLCIVLQYSNIKNCYSFSWLFDTEIPNAIKSSEVKVLLPLTVSDICQQVSQTITLMTQAMSNSWFGCDFVDILPFSHKDNSGITHYLEADTLEHLLSKLENFVKRNTQLENLATNLIIADVKVENIDHFESLNNALLAKASDLHLDRFLLVPIEGDDSCDVPYRALLNWTNKHIDN